mgnify:CR=1 FL=1
MKTWEIIAAIVLSTVQCAGILLLISPATRETIHRFIVSIFPRMNDTTEQDAEFNPCEACQRWGECNGVDRDNCPLWRTDERST